jgi:hypothetical protein
LYGRELSESEAEGDALAASGYKLRVRKEKNGGQTKRWRQVERRSDESENVCGDEVGRVQ